MCVSFQFDFLIGVVLYDIEPYGWKFDSNFLLSRVSSRKKRRKPLMPIFKHKLDQLIGIRKPNYTCQYASSLGDICACLTFNCRVSCSEIKMIISHHLVLLSRSPFFTAENSAQFVFCTVWIQYIQRDRTIVLQVFFVAQLCQLYRNICKTQVILTFIEIASWIPRLLYWPVPLSSSISICIIKLV